MPRVRSLVGEVIGVETRDMKDGQETVLRIKTEGDYVAEDVYDSDVLILTMVQTTPGPSDTSVRDVLRGINKRNRLRRRGR